MLYRLFIRPLLFLLNAEKAHYFALALLKASLRIPLLSSVVKAMHHTPIAAQHSLNLMGLHFPNPVGLAAGFDKDGKHYKELQYLGFGFLELGTVTPRPQSGNPRPRLFRLKKDLAVINRMGFNNEGVKALRKKLEKKGDFSLIIGGNIGKNKDTPNERALDDYLTCMKELHEVVDYFTINMSSPNTPNLRELQDKEPLRKILSALLSYNRSQLQPKPILLKIAPDLSDSQLDDIVEITKELQLNGLIATNTTISRDGLLSPEKELQSIGSGGLSGRPLTTRSLEIIRRLRQKLGPDYVLIGAGGIMTPEDARLMLAAGANLIQLYTGLIYNGPTLIKKILRYI